MKNLIILLLLLSTNKSCDQSTQKLSINGISYSAMTRGSSYNCTINKSNIKVSSKGRITENSIGIVSVEEWQTLNKLVQTISLGQLENLESPKSNSTIDRARIAKLVVEADGKTFESNSFDEGNPPEELKSLIELILRLAQTVE